MRKRPENFNPVTSSKTRFLETRPDGTLIYTHSAWWIHGNFIATNPDGKSWTAYETLELAQANAYA